MAVQSTQLLDFERLAEDVLLSKYSKAGIVVDEAGKVVYLRGNTVDFLEPSTGNGDTITSLAKAGLGEEFQNILTRVKKTSVAFKTGNIPLVVNGKPRNISIEGIPLPGNSVQHYLLVFHGDEALDTLQQALLVKKTGQKMKAGLWASRIKQLEQALAESQASMRRLAEEQEAINEELQSSNEELQCSGEELQSVNDQLEANKEELQNTNKSLTTLNHQLVHLNEQVTTGRLYAEAIIATVRQPMLVLDKSFRIRQANKAFYSTFKVNLAETENALIYDLGNKQWNIPKLHELLEEILPNKTMIMDHEVTHVFPFIGERVMQLNASEIIREKGEEKLILLSIEDITEKALLRRQEKVLQKQLEEDIQLRTLELNEVNEEMEQQNHAIAQLKYNRRFLTEFSEKFPAYNVHNGFFTSLTHFIADTTKLDYVFVGSFTPAEKKNHTIHTIALNAFGKRIENMQYALGDGPCEQVLKGVPKVFASQCYLQFPGNNMIVRMGVEGYVAHPLNDEQGVAVGLIAVMHSKKIDDGEAVASMLRVIAKRAEIELERVAYEEKLLQNNLTLEEKNSELIKMNKELQAFTFISSHDLQEPLRKIKTFSQLIYLQENNSLSEKGKDYLDRVNRAAFHMQRLITDLLDYSQTNNNERKFERTDLNRVVEEVKKELQELIEKKNVVFDIGMLGSLNIIPFQFRQLFNNLISNSIKFCPAGKTPYIRIHTETAKGNALGNELLAAEKDYCHITFADNGIGFSPEYSDKIFEIFQRLHSRDEFPGTGIGLAIVKKIVDNHRGNITATGVLDEGATFDIYLPLV